MLFFGVIVGLLLVIGIVAAFVSRNQEPADPNQMIISEGCCGMHQTCEKDSLLSALSPNIVYFEDEELDRFLGRESSDYTDEEIDEFREVLISLDKDEVAAWIRSIQNRNINIPDDLKPEILMIVSENRTSREKH